METVAVLGGYFHFGKNCDKKPGISIFQYDNYSLNEIIPTFAPLKTTRHES